MQSSGSRSLMSTSDVWIGLTFAVLGAIAAGIASGFDDASRAYPLGLSLLMSALGVLILINAVRGLGAQVSFVQPAQVAIPATIITVLWISGLTIGFGYLLPTFFMEVAFLTICGVRGFGRVTVYAALISGVSYLIFFIALDVRFPASLAPWLL